MTLVREGGSPLIDTISSMTRTSRDNAHLPDREVMLIRLACLIASGRLGGLLPVQPRRQGRTGA